MTNWKDVGDTIQSFATAGGIVFGGLFAYYKFFKDRIYRPRLDLEVDPRLIQLESDAVFLLCRLAVQNKGATKLSVRHAGTAVIVRPGNPGSAPLDATSWESLDNSAVVDVFTKHDWLESAETIRDDVLVRVNLDTHQAYRVELRFVVAAPSPIARSNIAISTGRVVATSRQRLCDDARSEQEREAYE